MDSHPLYALLPLVNSPAAAADFVVRATSAPDLFSFAYLVHHPSLTQHLPPPASSLLRIFASGTWADYKALTDAPSLSDAQATKLKQLTLVSMASAAHKIPYATLYSSLDLADSRALASLVVSCVYSNLLSATLDTRAQIVSVSAVRAGRDVVDKRGVEQLKTVIDTWSERCRATIEELALEARKAREASIKQSKDVREYNRVVDQINAQIQSQSGRTGKGGSGHGHGHGQQNWNGNGSEEVDGEPMDLDATSPLSDSSLNKKRKQRTVS
ncbi:hypothetical protein BZA70DRAFT_18622 [Myxozyma melibiosi]|uniref:PCI domain-containing protein n=1 Tax=Myxozyma melibiosi TaxID=54550 RepID=A0ABR1FCK5_9ASCO